jgi:hypothetical protein
MEQIVSPVQAELIRAACALAAKKEIQHLLYIGDLPIPEEYMKAKSTARRKLVQAVASEAQRQVIEAMGITTISLPGYAMARPERFKIALVGGIAQGLFQQDEVVLGMIARRPTTFPDTLLVVTIGAEGPDGLDTGFGVVGTERISSTVLETLIDLAVSISVEGWEGRSVGTLLVVGDTPAVMEKSRQLTLNPFQGYSETEKNILNPDVRDAIKNFAVLDGAFVIREDGVVLAAGRYLRFDEEQEVQIPLGLGARHMAAAGISQDTDAIAIVVSETSGEVRVFQGGQCLLHVHPVQRHRRGVVGQTGEIERVLAEAAPPPRERRRRETGSQRAVREGRRETKELGKV